MEIIKDCLNYHSDRKNIVTLGKFDGLHRGHRKLFEFMRGIRRDEGIAAFTFDYSIRDTLMGERSYFIFDDDEKRYILKGQGVDLLVECAFDDEVKRTAPEVFVEEYLVKGLNASCIVVGEDYHFGVNRSGDYRLLASLAKKYGYSFYRIPKEVCGGVSVSSTLIRSELSAGHIEKVNELLGIPYFCMGTVLPGAKKGRTLGARTVNLQLSERKLLPPFGVYFSKCIVDGNEYEAISNLGVKPTFDGERAPGLETHLLDYEGDLYGKEVIVEFYHFHRSEKRFESKEALAARIADDTQAALTYWRING